MANYSWRERRLRLRDRFPKDTIGLDAWRTLFEILIGQGDAAGVPSLREGRKAVDLHLEALDDFYSSVGHRASPRGTCRVFVSHQRRDVVYAERIADLAHQHGFEYWLDVHDPRLRRTHGAPLAPSVRAVLTAAIIEVALLNCSHLITVQTAQSHASRWVPYEFGRAKQHSVRSTQVASWFKTGAFQATKADYLKLGVCATSEADVKAWLATEWSRAGCTKSSSPWLGGPTTPLPN